MDTETLYIFQTCVSLFIHSSMVWLNLHLGWASVEALHLTGHLIIFYEMFDLMIGWERYMKKDKLMIFHHIVALSSGITMMHFLGSEDEEVVKMVQMLLYYGLLSEVTTIFNALRLLVRNCGNTVVLVSRAVFAVVFCTLRSVQTVGMGRTLLVNYSHPYMWTCFCYWFLFTCMNLYWMQSIVLTFRHRMKMWKLKKMVIKIE